MTITEEQVELERVAIIGMAGRFPGANNINDLWQNLCEGKESISYFSNNDLDPDINPSLLLNPNYIKARGIIDSAFDFDADFFGCYPRESQIMDPQNRIFLEVAWEALENAGYPPGTPDIKIGVFGGKGHNTYFTNYVSQDPRLIETFGEFETRLLNEKDFFTTQVSYKLNLTGPSININTGCSTSLVAVCLSFDSLINYQCDLAIAGGITIFAPQKIGYLYEEGKITSADGHCRPFDTRASGTVFSSGVGIVVLKRLSEAIEDGDHIYAVIRGTALNNDGSDKISFAAPSVSGQTDMITMAMANAGVEPEMISYIETHGTGTLLGDSIEIEALNQAFPYKTCRKRSCAIGSVKGNIGHLDAAAGVAGLIKTVLSLHHKMIPPTINFEYPHAKIDFENSPFYINTECVKWETGPNKRFAGVSSLGVGGTNAHVILEEAPETGKSAYSKPWHLLLLSAKTNSALDKATSNLVDYLSNHNDQNLADVAYTLQIGREKFHQCRIAVCQDIYDAINTLDKTDSKKVLTSNYEPINKDIVFMFSGQGTQYSNMGLGLYESEPVFREYIDQCSQILMPHLSFDLRDILYPQKYNIDLSTHKLKQTSVSQPALFTIEYALAKLWISWGIIPNALVGHSIGEYVAACISGVFSLEGALSLIAKRGQLIQDLPYGSMLVVFLSEKEIQSYLNEKVSLSAVNGPSLCVISGEKNEIKNIQNDLSAREIYCRYLHTSHAFHSNMMEPILDLFEKELKKINMDLPRIPFISNVSGKEITSNEATSPSYWVKHLRNPVRFSECLQELFKEQNRVFMEIGPGNTLTTLTRQHPDIKEGHRVFSSVRHPNENISDRAFILKSVGQLWFEGIKFDWQKMYAEEYRKRVPLPTYPFERKPYRIEKPRKKHGPRIEVPRIPEELSVRKFPKKFTKDSDFENEDSVSRNNVERILTNIWKKLLGYRQIELNDNFFDLGGNSLVAVRMFTEIEKVFGKRLPLVTLYEASTIKQLTDIIRQEEYSPSWESLVKIQSSHSSPPFFCVHSAEGNVLEYRELVKYVGNDQTFYGLQPKGLEGKEVINITIEEMAANYINEIKKVQPKGPYHIGGYCLGGLVAFEMAHQLQRNGEEIALLVLISTSTPDHLGNIKPKLTSLHRLFYRILQRIELETDNISALGTKAKAKYVLIRAERMKQKVQYHLANLLNIILSRFHLKYRLRSRLYVLEKNVKYSNDAYMKYIAKPLKNKVFLFRASKQNRMLLYDPALGWQRLAENGLHIYEVHGFHKNILKEPNVRALAYNLRALLRNAGVNH